MCWRIEGGVLSNDTSCADTLSTLRNKKFALLLDRFIDIVAFVSTIWLVIMRNVVDIMLCKELWRDDPRAVRDNLIHPLAVSDRLCTLSPGQNGQAFALVGFSVTRDADEETGLWKGGLGLFELPHVAVL